MTIWCFKKYLECNVGISTKFNGIIPIRFSYSLCTFVGFDLMVKIRLHPLWTMNIHRAFCNNLEKNSGNGDHGVNIPLHPWNNVNGRDSDKMSDDTKCLEKQFSTSALCEKIIQKTSLFCIFYVWVTKSDYNTIHPSSIGYLCFKTRLIFSALPRHYLPSFTCYYNLSSLAESVLPQSTLRVMTHENGKKASRVN